MLVLCMLVLCMQLPKMLLAKSSSSPASHDLPNPRVASHVEVEKAAEVLKDSKELLAKLKAKLLDKDNPVRPRP